MPHVEHSGGLEMTPSAAAVVESPVLNTANSSAPIHGAGVRGWVKNGHHPEQAANMYGIQRTGTHGLPAKYLKAGRPAMKTFARSEYEHEQRLKRKSSGAKYLDRATVAGLHEIKTKLNKGRSEPQIALCFDTEPSGCIRCGSLPIKPPPQEPVKFVVQHEGTRPKDSPRMQGLMKRVQAIASKRSGTLRHDVPTWPPRPPTPTLQIQPYTGPPVALSTHPLKGHTLPANFKCIAPSLNYTQGPLDPGSAMMNTKAILLAAQ